MDVFSRMRRFSIKYPSLSVQNWSYILFNYGLAVVLGFSGIAKLLDSSGLLSTLQQLTFLNSEFIVLAATLLPIIEIGLAMALFWQWKSVVAFSCTLLLFAGFLGFSLYGMYTGLTGDCGCFGRVAENNFGWGMIARNLILFCAAGYLLVQSITGNNAP